VTIVGLESRSLLPSLLRAR